MTERADVTVVGAGPAGLAAAIAAKEAGAGRVLVLERDAEPGGILQQCIHAGFGLHIFGQELTGPEYAQRFIDAAREAGVEIKCGATVLSVGAGRAVQYISPADGLVTVRSGAAVLAMGCRERPRGMVGIPGTRPAGVMTAGTAQYLVNRKGYLPGKKVVILGSGDIGLIMARRMSLEGAEVRMVLELMPEPGGLARNRVQCLEDFGIPLLLSHTVADIHGRERLEAVTVARVDERLRPVPESVERVECDTLLLSVGLIPENELSRAAGVSLDGVTSGPVVNESMETSVPGVFACGNVVQVHDLADNVTLEARLAGRRAALYALGKTDAGGRAVKTAAGEGVRYIVPHTLRPGFLEDGARLYFRVTKNLRKASVVVAADGKVVKRIRRPRVSPGEMESVPLDAALRAALQGAQTLAVSLEGGEPA